MKNEMKILPSSVMLGDSIKTDYGIKEVFQINSIGEHYTLECSGYSLKIHCEEHVLENGQINLQTLEIVGRNNKDSYTKVSNPCLFDLKKP